MLTENEWNTINNMLLELYTIDELDVFTSKIMKMIRMLIPYTKGWFIISDDDRKIRKEQSYFIGLDTDVKDKYTDVFYNEDYIQYLYDFVSETSVYKDTSILESDVREKTDFYIKFLKPEDIIFGCGIILIKNSRIIGMFNLFRNEKSGDFNEKELYVLNLLKNHIANMLHNVMRLDRASITVNKSLNNFAKTYGLTARESEILSLINKGLSNQEISDKVVISVSTVKKHIYNIYNKTGVSSRGQLISLFLE